MSTEVSFSPETHTDDFHTDQVLTIAGGHFVHDTFSAFLAPLLPILQERLQTNYVLTGGLAIFTQIPSLLNPFIGYLADRISLRYFIILAPGITATLMGSLGLTSSYTVLALLLLAAGISLAAFHAPAPAMIARVSGSQVGKGMSFFMASGELGRTFGPIVVVLGLRWFGLSGLWQLALAGWVTSLALYLRLRHVSARPPRSLQTGFRKTLQNGRSFFLILSWLLICRVFLTVPITTYLPLFMTNVSQVSLELSAGALTILEGAGVVGALFAGTLSDRWGRLRMLGLLTLLSSLLLLALLVVPGWLVVPTLLALGLIGLSPTPVIMALVQDRFPHNRALANGIYIGINFLARAIAIWAVGSMADRFGLGDAFLISALVSLSGLSGVYLLVKTADGVVG